MHSSLRSSRFLAVILALASLGAAGACGNGARPSPPGAPNVLLVMIDTLRADHLSSYGYPRRTTPTLDRLASEGVRFEHAYAPSATTGPSTVSLFTSLHPLTHGYLKNGLVLDLRFTTLAERFRDAGWQTFGLASSVPLAAPNLDQGFETYDRSWPEEESSPDDANPGKFVRYARSSKSATDHALEWFRTGRDRARPFFAYVHYMDPHEPYTAPERFVGMFPPPPEGLPPRDRNIAEQVRGYDAEVRYTDTELGRLLDDLEATGALENTIVVVVADHGQGLFQHGWPGHGWQLYEESVHVPWIMRWPGHLEAGRIVQSPVSLLDVGPTLLSYAAIELVADTVQGRNLAPAVTGATPPEPDRSLFFVRAFLKDEVNPLFPSPVKGRLFGMRRGSWKYLEGPDARVFELYDLAADPGETRNLYAAHPEAAAVLAGDLQRWRTAHGAEVDERSLAVPEDLRKGLEALGYVQ